MEGNDTISGPTWDEARWASRRNLSAWLMGLLSGALLVLAIGCSTPQNHDLSPNTGATSYGRSVSFLPAGIGDTPAYVAPRWYHARNDAGLEVFAGYDIAEETWTTTRSSTRLHVHDGRVRDHSRTWTNTETVLRRVR